MVLRAEEMGEAKVSFVTTIKKVCFVSVILVIC